MANIRAGVAYVDVRLGSIDELKNKMKAGIEDIGKDAGKQLGENIKKNTPTAPVAELGQKLDKELSKAFFKDAKTEFTGGLRALATGQFGTAKDLFVSAGRNFGTSVTNGFKNGIRGIENGFASVSEFAGRAGTAITNGLQGGWSKAMELGKALDSASQKMGFLSFQIQNFGILASAAFTAPIAGALGFATVIGIKTAAQIESATAALKFLLPVGYNVEALLERLKKIALDSPIFDSADLITYTQKFTAAGVSVDETTRFLKAFSNIALVTGANTDQANRAIVAITQVFGKGKLQAEELNQQLGEAMPAVLKLLRDQYGVTQKEFAKMVKEGKISGEDLIGAFIKIGESKKFLDGARSGAETLNAVWQNLKESLQTQLGQFFLDNSKQIKAAVEKLGPAISDLIKDAAPLFLGLINGFTKVVEWISRVIKWYEKLDPSTKNFIIKAIQIAAILGPVVLVLGSFMGALAGVAAGIAAVLTPVGAIIAGIIAVGIAVGGVIVWLKKFGGESSGVWTSIKKGFDSFVSSIQPVIDGAKNLWGSIKTAFDQIRDAIGGNTGAWKSWAGFLKTLFSAIWTYLKALWAAILEVLKGALTAVGNIIEAIGSLISGAIKIFKGLTDFLIGVFTGDWKRAWTGIKEIFTGLWDTIYGVLAGVSKAIGNIVWGMIQAVIKFFKSLYDTLVGHSIIPDMVNAIINWFNKLASFIRGVINTIKSIFSGFASAVKAFANLFASGVKQVLQFMGELPGKIKNSLSALGETLYNIGKNVIQGFVNGMSSIGQRAIDKAKDIANSVKNIVKGALGIGSPSRVFREYGRNVVQGFVLGISGEQDQLTKTLSTFADKPRFEQVNGSANAPIANGGTSASAAISIENYYANDEVDPWRQAEDWYFLITSRGGVA